MARRTIRRHRHPRPNTSLPAMLSLASANATTKVFSLAAHLNSLVPSDGPLVTFSSLGEMIQSAAFSKPSTGAAMLSEFPAFAPFYATAVISISSTIASEVMSNPGDAIVADSTTLTAMASSQSSAGKSSQGIMFQIAD